MPESTSTQSRDYNKIVAHDPGIGFYARININPVAGLQQILYEAGFKVVGQNQHQPSRGITTRSRQWQRYGCERQNQHQPSRGITTYRSSYGWLRRQCQNQHQPSRGITTSRVLTPEQVAASQNQHQPSRGIKGESATKKGSEQPVYIPAAHSPFLLFKQSSDAIQCAGWRSASAPATCPRPLV